MPRPFLIALWVIVRIVAIVVPIAGSGGFNAPRHGRASNTQCQLDVECQRAQHPHHGLLDAREVTQAVFTFSAASGQTLQQGAPLITVPMDALFWKWFQDPANNAWKPVRFDTTVHRTGGCECGHSQSVTLTNQIGSVTAPVLQ